MTKSPQSLFIYRLTLKGHLHVRMKTNSSILKKKLAKFGLPDTDALAAPSPFKAAISFKAATTATATTPGASCWPLGP